MGVVFEEDVNFLSLYQSIVQKQKMKKGAHPLQQYAADMLEMMGIPGPKGDEATFDLGLQHLQNLSEE